MTPAAPGTSRRRPLDWPLFVLAGLLTGPSLLGVAAFAADWGGEAPELLGPVVLLVWVLTAAAYVAAFWVRRRAEP